MQIYVSKTLFLLISNRSWKDLHIFADLNCFYDLDEILDKAKKEKASTLLFILPDWKETDSYRRFDFIRSELLSLPNVNDLCLDMHDNAVGILNFQIWIGLITDFEYPYLQEIDFSDWGGDVVDMESEEV